MMEKILASIYGLEYDCGISENAVNESGLISANKFFLDCFISGKYNGISFVQAKEYAIYFAKSRNG